MNLFNKIKSQLKLSLPFLIFCLGVTVLFLFIYVLFVMFLDQKQFYYNIFEKYFFLIPLNISMNKISLNLLVKRQFSFTYIRVFNNDSFTLNQILLIQSGDVELNPSLKKSSSLTFFHRNLNGITAHDLIQSYALSYNTNITFLFENFLDSSIEASAPNIDISRYNSLRFDHPSNTKRGFVCICYKDYLPAIKRDDLCALPECIVTDIKLGKKSIYFTCNYRSPSQTPGEFKNYCQKFPLHCQI